MTVSFSAAARSARTLVAGRALAKGVSFGVLKSKAVVRSPQTARRQGETLGSATPNRVSRKRITEVWSKTCELTQPPRLQGDST
ncbi:hypothetical protein D3C87_1920810 [compost metagenome]